LFSLDVDTALCRKYAEEILARVTAHFPRLQCDVHASPGPVDYSANFSVQPGLSFPVGLHLDGDVLGLYAGANYHQDFFPASDKQVAAEVERYLYGLLSGDCRVIEHGPEDRATRALLEQRMGDSWVVRSRWSRPHIPFIPRARRTLHNI
jgi:hypothetical protein